MLNFNQFNDTNELDRQLAQAIIHQLTQGISQNGYASLVVSGGKTPAGLFKVLAQQPIAWDKVFITLADERWVPASDGASNEKSVRDNLLQYYAEKATFIGLANLADDPFTGAEAAEQVLNKIPRPFDVVILGMGEDGHTASLFPGATNLASAMDIKSTRACTGITPLTAPNDRITLTLATLLNSKQIYLHIVGSNKKKVYDKALASNDASEMPIRAFLQQTQVPVSVFWTASA